MDFLHRTLAEKESLSQGHERIGPFMLQLVECFLTNHVILQQICIITRKKNSVFLKHFTHKDKERD